MSNLFINVDGVLIPVGGGDGGGLFVLKTGDEMTGLLEITTSDPQLKLIGDAAFHQTISDGWMGWIGLDTSGNRRWAFESDPGFGGLDGRMFLLKIYDSLGANDQQIFRATIDKMRFDVPLEMGGNQIKDMVDGTDFTDAITKQQLDAVVLDDLADTKVLGAIADDHLVFDGDDWLAERAVGGEVAYVSPSPFTTSSSTLIDWPGMSVTWQADPTRIYKITAFCADVLSNAGGDGKFQLSLLTGADAFKQFFNGHYTFGDSGSGQLVLREAGLSGSITRKIRVSTSLPSCDFASNALEPAFILVEDIGAA